MPSINFNNPCHHLASPAVGGSNPAAAEDEWDVPYPTSHNAGSPPESPRSTWWRCEEPGRSGDAPSCPVAPIAEQLHGSVLSSERGPDGTPCGAPLPRSPSTAWWRCEGTDPASGAHPTSAVLPVASPRAPVVPDSVESPEEADETDISDMLEALATPYEYTPVKLSFGCFGPLSADTQVFRLRNICGQKVEVKDSAGQLFLKGEGHFKPVGYYFEFFDSIGRHAFSVSTVDLQEEETYEFIGPHGMVIATAIRRRFNPRTDLRVCANTAKSDTLTEVECRSVRRALTAGRYQVTSRSGDVLGAIRRHHRKGVVTHQKFTVVVGPEVDPYLMVFLTMVCNCVNNERSKLGWAIGAASLATILI